MARGGWLISHNEILVGGFKHFLFSSLFGEDEPILTSIFFQMGWFNHQLEVFFWFWECSQILGTSIR